MNFKAGHLAVRQEVGDARRSNEEVAPVWRVRQPELVDRIGALHGALRAVGQMFGRLVVLVGFRRSRLSEFADA